MAISDRCGYCYRPGLMVCNNCQEKYKTPEQWAAEDGIKILEPDGWRMPGSPSFRAPTTREDYESRIWICTTIKVSGPQA